MSSNYKRNVLAITIAHSSCEYWSSACDMIFPAAGNGVLYSRKSFLQVLQQNSGRSCSNKTPLYKTPTLVRLSDQLCNWNRRVWLCYFNAWCNRFYCCRVMKFVLQPGNEAKVYCRSFVTQVHRVTTKILAMVAILTKYPVLLWVCLWLVW